jgi:hypothetical protein
MVRRRWVVGISTLLVLIAASSLSAQSATAVDRPRAPRPRNAMISFPLPQREGERFSPNARNFARSGRAGGPLLLFLPATRAVPSDYREFLDTASSVGFHVLALDYWNRGKSVVKTCAGIPDCYATVQQNRLNGTHPSVWSAIAPRDSIVNRLRAALGHLRQADPSGDWSRYATGNRIHWNRIVVAGHSQGGGQSAFIAHEHRVQGALMFSSPVQSDSGVPASWLVKKGATPVSRMYGFVSAHDMYYENVVGSWEAMGMGAPATTDGSLDFGKAHTIVSDVVLGTPDESHLWTVNDGTPRGAHGVPVFETIWKWMLQRVR